MNQVSKETPESATNMSSMFRMPSNNALTQHDSFRSEYEVLRVQWILSHLKKMSNGRDKTSQLLLRHVGGDAGNCRRHPCEDQIQFNIFTELWIASRVPAFSPFA